MRPAHTSEPLQQPQPLAPSLGSPTATSRRSTDPDGSTGDEAIAASLRAYATTAHRAIEAEMEKINEIQDTAKEDDVSAMTTSLPSTSKKLEPIESTSASPHGRKKNDEPTIAIIPEVVSAPFVYQDIPSTDIPWLSVVSYPTRSMILALPGRMIDDIQRDMNRYANGDDSPKNIAMAEYLFTKAYNDLHPPPSLEIASSSGGSTSTNNSVLESLSKVNDNMDLISLRLTSPSSDVVLTHDDKQVMNSKYGDFEMLPKAFTYESMCKWKLRIANRLNSPPWKLDGVSILDMKDMADASDRYKLRTNKLCNHLHDIMLESGLDSMSMQLQPTISKGFGVSLFVEIFDTLLPLTTMKIISCIRELGTVTQRNEESAHDLASRVSNLWDRFDLMGYTTLDQVKTAFVQRAFLDGVYKDEKCLDYIDSQLIQGDIKLSDYSTDKFVNHMNQIFTNSDVYSAGRMKKLNARHVARAASQGGLSTDQSNSDAKNANMHIDMNGDFGLVSSSGGNSKVTVFDVANMLKMTNCLACRYPKNDVCNHHMHNCGLLEEFGLTVTYDPEKDQHREKVSKRIKQRARDSDKKKQAAAIVAGASAPASTPAPATSTGTEGYQTVGKNGKDVKTNQDKVAAEKKNVASQGTNAGSGRIASLGSFTSGGDFVDAHTAINDIKEDSTGYFAPIYSELSRLSRMDPITNRMTHCIGSCKKAVAFVESMLTVQSNCNRKVCSANTPKPKRQIVPDSGATTHMLTDRDDFGEDYKQCRDVFVYMGDGTPVPVHGYGTGRIKLDGKVQALKKSLHVPSLDCSLMSITRHGRSGKGCAFLIADSEMHLTFPNFSITAPVPENGDLRLELEPLSADDWGEPDFTYEDEGDDFLDVLSNRLDFLNRVHRGRVLTRGQRTKNQDQLLSCLKNTTADIDAARPSSPDVDAQPSSCDEPFDDDYLCEGDPGEMLKQALTELDVNDIRDFLNDGSNSDMPFEKQLRAPPPQYHLESSRGDVKERLTNHTLQSYFGGRQLQDYGVLSQLGTGISVVDNKNEIPTVGSLVNRKRGKRRQKGSKAIAPLQLVGMDIGYGDGNSPGGYKYALVLVDKCTTNSFVYGMHGASGADVAEALWKFFIDAGGFPETIQCDFDPKLIGGKAIALLRSHGCRVRAAPPGRQDKNGLVERRWSLLTSMARSFLAEAKLPKKFWYWAIREACVRLNVLPISSNSDSNAAEFLTTPHEAFYGEKPDYRVLFPFGCIGAFRRVRDSNRDRTKFESQGLLGIALGRSEFTNGMVFYNPTMDSFCTSADYILDKRRLVGEVFPNLQYDGGLTTSVISNSSSPTKFDIHEKVYIQCQESYDILEATVVTPPTSKSNYYTVKLDDSSNLDVQQEHMFTEHNIPASGKPSLALDFLRPKWLKQDQPVTMLLEDVYRQGYLSIGTRNTWEFVTRDREGKIIMSADIADIAYSWKHRLQENTFDIGWQDDIARRVVGWGRHVSAAHLHNPLAPANLKKALHESNKDNKIWKDAYNEEYSGLKRLDTFTEINEKDYQNLLKEHGKDIEAIPTMNLFTVKKDKEGNPVRAKSRIVVLGNHENRVWTREDRYAPVLSSSAARLLVSMAVDDGCYLKQGDCKNAFCQPELPDDELCIVRPPIGCPNTKKGTYWKLNKTLYGLSRSAHHWYTLMDNLLKDIGFESMGQDRCVYKCTPIPGKPPICLGLYVDDFVFYSKSEEVEEWFEQQLKSKVKVDFMGTVSWFLGQAYEWHRFDDGRVTCHISQQAFIDQMLEKHKLTDCKPSRTPYRSGLVIDRVNRDEVDPCDKEELVNAYQSIMGGLTWLSINTRPDICTATKLLGQFCSNPSYGHFQSAKYVLRYLSHTSSHGIWFTQGDNVLEGNVGLPEIFEDEKTITFTDSNWGSQDASQPRENEKRIVTAEEMKSIQGYYITRMGGPICWGVYREKRLSGSSCIAEIKAMHEGVKEIQYLRHLMRQLGLSDVNNPTPVLNDNKGSVDWVESGCKATKKLRHENISELSIAEGRLNGEVNIAWIPGKTNPADIFTKEDKDVGHFEGLRNLMVKPRESVRNLCK